MRTRPSNEASPGAQERGPRRRRCLVDGPRLLRARLGFLPLLELSHPIHDAGEPRNQTASMVAREVLDRAAILEERLEGLAVLVLLVGRPSSTILGVRVGLKFDGPVWRVARWCRSLHLPDATARHRDRCQRAVHSRGRRLRGSDAPQRRRRSRSASLPLRVDAGRGSPLLRRRRRLRLDRGLRLLGERRPRDGRRGRRCARRHRWPMLQQSANVYESFEALRPSQQRFRLAQRRRSGWWCPHGRSWMSGRRRGQI